MESEGAGRRILYDSEDEEEALSLSDLPVGAQGEVGGGGVTTQHAGSGHEVGEFEFFGSWVGEMCAAEDVFYQGRILPLRPSVSSDPGLRSRSRPGSSCFDSSRSSSLNSSSSSSGRRSDSLLLHPFFTHPSPKPQMGRRSFGGPPASGGRRSGGWGLLRLGLVQPPPSTIELQDLKQRSFRKSSVHVNSIDTAKNKLPPTTDSNSNEKKDTARKKEEGGGSWLAGLSCKCSASAVDTVLPTVIVNKRRESTSPPPTLAEEEEEGEGEAAALVGGRRRRRVADRRTYEWLVKLSIDGGGGPQA